MSLLMIGCGKMGGALLGRWARLTDQEITVIDPALDKAIDGVTLATDIKALGSQTFDIIVIAIKPQLIEMVLPDYRAHLAKDGCLISMAAGYSVASLEKLMGPRSIFRIMPNLPAEVGRGVTALYGNQYCSAQHRHLAQLLTDAVGHTLPVDDEDAIDRVTAVAGSGPGYAFEIARCWISAAEHLGFSPTEARELVLNTIVGAAELALQSDASMTDLRNSVTSKNGTTEAGLKELMKADALHHTFEAAIQAAYARAVELR